MPYIYTHEGLTHTDTEYIFHGWRPECPNCGSIKTSFTCMPELRNWMCTECGLYEAPIEEWIGRPADRDIFYD